MILLHYRVPTGSRRAWTKYCGALRYYAYYNIMFCVSYEAENEPTRDIRYTYIICMYVFKFKLARTSLAHNLFTSTGRLRQR